MQTVIGDFGLARTSGGANELMTEYVVTHWNRPPDLLVLSDHSGASIDIRSVGCIFVEILGHKPIFQGIDALKQLILIINVLGTPREADLEFIEDPRPKRFIQSLPYCRGTDFWHMFPGSNPMSIDRRKRMLVVDPRKRITVGEVLKHPYLERLYDLLKDTSARSPIHLHLEGNRDERMIRQAI